MPWIMGKVVLPQTTGTHTVQVPEGAKIMVAMGKITLDVIYMAEEGALPQDMRFDVLNLGDTQPGYDKRQQRYIGVVDLSDEMFIVFERINEIVE